MDERVEILLTVIRECREALRTTGRFEMEMTLHQEMSSARIIASEGRLVLRELFPTAKVEADGDATTGVAWFKVHLPEGE